MFSSSITSALYQHNQLRGTTSDHMEILCHALDLSVSLKLLSEINTIFTGKRSNSVEESSWGPAFGKELLKHNTQKQNLRVHLSNGQTDLILQ